MKINAKLPKPLAEQLKRHVEQGANVNALINKAVEMHLGESTNQPRISCNKCRQPLDVINEYKDHRGVIWFVAGCDTNHECPECEEYSDGYSAGVAEMEDELEHMSYKLEKLEQQLKEAKELIAKMEEGKNEDHVASR